MSNIAFDYNLETTPWSVTYKPISRPVMSWREEVIETARYVRSLTDKPIAIAMSGGIDSEVLALAFKEAGIPFKALTVCHTEGSNVHDISYANRFCEREGIEQIKINVSIVKLFTQGINEYVSQGYGDHSIFRYLQLFIIEQAEKLGYCCVMGGTETMINTFNDKLCINLAKGVVLPFEWIRRNNTIHFPYFFQATPEIAAAWFKDELIELLTKTTRYFTNRRSHKGYQDEKAIIFHRDFPTMQRRRKFNGFENIRELQQAKYKELVLKFPMEDILVPVNDIKTQLGI